MAVRLKREDSADSLRDTVSTDSEGSAPIHVEAASRALRHVMWTPALDRFGFVVAAGHASDAPGPGANAVVQGEPRALSPGQARRENAKLHKWSTMLGVKWGGFSKGPRRLLLKRRVHNGVPDAIRGHVWALLSDVERAADRLPAFEHLFNKCPRRVVSEIFKDVERTFPEHELFLPANRRGGRDQAGGAAMLSRVLCAYAAYDPEVAYCQGLNYLAAVFLMYAPQERAFLQLVALLEHSGLRALFLPGLPGAEEAFAVFDGLLGRFLPRLKAHLDAEGIPPSMYATRWFMTLFVGCLPFEACARAMDVVLHDHDAKVAHRLGLAVLQAQERRLLAASGCELMEALRSAPRACTNVDALFKRAYAIPLRRAHIEDLAQKHHRGLAPPEASAATGR